jgi:hypothetical protein
VAERADVTQHLLGGRENVMRPRERGLHDQHVRARRGAGFRRTAAAQFEVTGVQQRAMRLVHDQALRRTVDMSGRVQRDRGIGGELFRLLEWQHVFHALAGHPRLHEARRSERTQDFAVRRDVIGVGVGDEGTLLREMRVQPPRNLRQPYSGVEFNFP